MFSMWWLRDTTYDDICRALVVKGDGSFDDTGYSICSEDGFGVRPGFHLNEHCSGDLNTDWSSELKKMTIEDSQNQDGETGARDIEPPDNNWHEPVMNPGDTYDCTDEGWNTSVYIKKAGSYTIKGQSNNVRVMIESTGIKLYLADGLNLNCGATTYVGSRSAAINIMLDSGEKDGWVSIISKKNASAYLEGYMAPGIEKDDTKTQLIFDTEDTKNPGTITAKGGLVSAGIGSIEYLPEKTGTTGNMFFNAGNIKAYGGSEEEIREDQKRQDREDHLHQESPERQVQIQSYIAGKRKLQEDREDSDDKGEVKHRL